VTGVPEPGCLFCAIVAGEVPAQVVHETPQTMAFRDVAPQAPVHLLVIPRDHHRDLTALVDADPALAGELMAVSVAVARQEGLEEDGYRLAVNTGRDGGQTVFHLHVHVLGGRHLGWPPG
jgi:histidine triad (HIT) family protein